MRLGNLSRALAVLGTLAAAGCTDRYGIDKPGATEEQKRVDWGLCGGNFSPHGGLRIESGREMAVYRCMSDRGYAVEILMPGIDIDAL